jgi:hypothetical protein
MVNRRITGASVAMAVTLAVAPGLAQPPAGRGGGGAQGGAPQGPPPTQADIEYTPAEPQPATVTSSTSTCPPTPPGAGNGERPLPGPFRTRVWPHPWRPCAQPLAVFLAVASIFLSHSNQHRRACSRSRRPM